MSTGSPRIQARAWILYEDSRAASKHFRPHDFVVANVHDVLTDSGGVFERHRLDALIQAIPKGPNTQVLRALARDAEKLHAGTSAIVAWLDDDQIHRALSLTPGQSASTLTEEVRKRVPASIPSAAVRIHLVQGNMEQFLHRIDRAQPGTLDAAALSEAFSKDLTARDVCFKEAALARHAGWRKLVRAADPGFGETILYLADLVTSEPWPPWA